MSRINVIKLGSKICLYFSDTSNQNFDYMPQQNENLSRLSRKVKNKLYSFKNYALYFCSKLIPPYIDFPIEIRIENTNCCNSRCLICPREKLTRALGYMDFGLYEKIISEVSKFRHKIYGIHLSGFGEPLLDTMLPSRIKLAKSLGIKKTRIITNASLLTSEKSKQIIEAGLDSMRISFYGTNENEYNSIMKGLNFTTTFENIKTFLKIRKNLKKNNPKVQINYTVRGVKTSEPKKPRMLFDDLIDRKIGDTVVTTYLHNYGEGREYNYVPSRKIISICRRPWSTFEIRYDGKVPLCTFDYNGNQVRGDVCKNSIEEIWNSQDFARVRLDFKNLNYQDYALCLKCDQLRRH